MDIFNAFYNIKQKKVIIKGEHFLGYILLIFMAALKIERIILMRPRKVRRVLNWCGQIFKNFPPFLEFLNEIV
jgi:hypothetical protein